MAYVVRKLVEQYFYLNDDCSGSYHPELEIGRVLSEVNLNYI